jgi:hypothetical protein
VLSEQHTGVNLERKRGATRISALPALARPLEMDGRGTAARKKSSIRDFFPDRRPSGGRKRSQLFQTLARGPVVRGLGVPTFPGLAPPVFIRGGGWFLIPASRGFFRGLRQAVGCARFIERSGCARDPISARHISQYRRTSFMRWPKVGAKTGKWHGGTGMYFVAVIRAIRTVFTHRRYRPELHYMRGPGPKWFERHGR